MTRGADSIISYFTADWLTVSQRTNQIARCLTASQSAVSDVAVRLQRELGVYSRHKEERLSQLTPANLNKVDLILEHRI